MARFVLINYHGRVSSRKERPPFQQSSVKIDQNFVGGLSRKSSHSTGQDDQIENFVCRDS